MITSSRRSFITGLVSFVAAPAIVRAANIMPVKSLNEFDGLQLWQIGDVTEEIYGRSPMIDALPEIHAWIPRHVFALSLKDGWAGHPGRQPR